LIVGKTVYSFHKKTIRNEYTWRILRLGKLRIKVKSIDSMRNIMAATKTSVLIAPEVELPVKLLGDFLILGLEKMDRPVCATRSW